MIPKATDNSGVNPLVRIMPVLSVANIGDPLQELGARAAQFAKGHEYFGHVVSKVSDTAFYVKVENSLFKMDLGASASVGQSLLLKYLQDSPVPTFALSQESAANSAKNNVTTASFSPTGQLIVSSLKQAEADGVSTKYEAQAVITHTPKNPEVVAQDLKHALSRSGLFYESHLSGYVEGHRSLADIKQEPQNQLNSTTNALLPQQLAILENQRLSWHGDVWPGQKMDWDIYLQQEQASAEGGNHQSAANEKPIASDLTLYLPHLGKVSAKLSLVDGRMRIRILAEEAQTLATLKQQSKNLADAIEKNGQKLEGLTVAGLAVAPHD